MVTNAHVVAGESSTGVQLRGVGRELAARVVVFDPHNDIAILKVPGLSASALLLASGPAVGEPAAILGYPLNGGFDRRPGRLGQTETTTSSDALRQPRDP